MTFVWIHRGYFIYLEKVRFSYGKCAILTFYLLPHTEACRQTHL